MISWLKWGSSGVRPRRLESLADALATLRDVVRFTQAVAELATDLSKLEILQGRLVEATTDGTTNANWIPHGLGRPYRGAILLGQNNSTAPIVLLSAASTVSNSQDPGRVFGTRQAVALAATFKAWVF